MPWSFIPLFLLSLLSSLTLASLRIHILEATLQSISIGCQLRESVVSNGTSPGPLIKLK